MLDLVLEIDHILTGKTYFQMEQHRVRITICQKRIKRKPPFVEFIFSTAEFHWGILLKMLKVNMNSSRSLFRANNKDATNMI